MKVTFRTLVFAMLLGGAITNVSASAVITDVTASGPGLGSFSLGEIFSTAGGYGLVPVSETFTSVNPITLTFNVEHSDADRKPYDIQAAITNGTSSAFTDYHLHISEPNGVVFSSFDATNDEFGPDFSPNFTLDLASKDQFLPFLQTGPRDLNFTGELQAGQTIANSYYSLTLPDPGAGNTYTFTVTQTQTVGVVPEPETYAMLLAGLGLVGFIARRRKQTS
ncbi:MAG: PEP-CTERM sorting domain-containing protein [Nitrosospira sp.]